MTLASVATTRRALLDTATTRLAAAGVATARADAEWLLAGLSGIGRAGLVVRLDRAVDPLLAERYAAVLARRERREPLQRILGWEGFCGLRFTLTPEVLVPRPETELLVELALTLLPSGARRSVVVDVGTGSGCIACAVAHERPAACVVAIDVSVGALAVAHRNVSALGLSGRIRLVGGDLIAAIGPQQADLVVANLPYLPTALLASLTPEVRDHEPCLALDGGGDGLNLLRPLVADARRALRVGGALVLETAGNAQAREIGALLTRTGFTEVAIRADLTGTERFVLGRWPGCAEPARSSAGFARAIPGEESEGAPSPFRSVRSAGFARATPGSLSEYRGAPRVPRGAPSVGGYGGPFGAPHLL